MPIKLESKTALKMLNIRNGCRKPIKKVIQSSKINQYLFFQTYAEIQLVTMFVKGIPPIIFALFVGPWSDKFGRKFLIIFPLIGK